MLLKNIEKNGTLHEIKVKQRMEYEKQLLEKQEEDEQQDSNS